MTRSAIALRLPALLVALFMSAHAATSFAAQKKEQEPAQTPAEVFLAYRAALARATSYAELLPFMDAKVRGVIEGLQDDQRSGMFELLKKFAGTFTEVSVTRETVTDGTAVLTLAGKDLKDQPATGSVPMTKEADGWKVGTEKWSSKPR